MSSKRYRILVVEDDVGVTTLVSAVLAQNKNFEMVHASDLQKANHAIATNRPDVVILDWMLPDGSGVNWLANLRQNVTLRELAVVMLTARGTETDKIEGLEKGADDYLTKPFSPKELLARINALLRRRYPDQHVSVLRWGNITLDHDSAMVMVNQTPLTLSHIEFRLLKFLLSRPEKVFSREQLLDHVWGPQVAIEPRTVDVNISRLRRALKNSEITVATLRGLGYALQKVSA